MQCKYNAALWLQLAVIIILTMSFSSSFRLIFILLLAGWVLLSSCYCRGKALLLQSLSSTFIHVYALYTPRYAYIRQLHMNIVMWSIIFIKTSSCRFYFLSVAIASFYPAITIINSGSLVIRPMKCLAWWNATVSRSHFIISISIYISSQLFF